MKKPPELVPWIKYPVTNAVFELTRVSPEAELAHRRLSDWHWQTGKWAAAGAGSAGQLCRVPPARWPGVLGELRSVGWCIRRARLNHSGVHQVRAEAVSALRARRTGGRLGAERRWTAQNAPEQPSGSDEAADGSAMGDLKVSYGLPMGTPMQIRDKSKSKSKKESTKTKRLTDERLTFTGSAQEKCSEKERDFLRELQEVLLLWSPAFAKDELANWGGWWRNRFRENPAKAQRVIAELRAMIKEGGIKGNPGAVGVDLWKRFP